MEPPGSLESILVVSSFLVSSGTLLASWRVIRYLLTLLLRVLWRASHSRRCFVYFHDPLILMDTQVVVVIPERRPQMTRAVLSSLAVRTMQVSMHAVTGLLDNVRIHLFTNTPILGRDMVYSDFVEPTFTGYNVTTAAAFGDWAAYIGADGNNFLGLVVDRGQVVTATGGTDVVNGWFIENSGAGQVVAAGYFDTPVPMQILGQRCDYNPMIGIVYACNPVTVGLV
jgi:hypothetical protein